MYSSRQNASVLFKRSSLVAAVLAAMGLLCNTAPAAQGSQNLQALKAETAEFCRKARLYQKVGKEAWQRSKDPSATKAMRDAARAEAENLLPFYERFKSLCLQKKTEYKNAMAGASSRPPSPPSNDPSSNRLNILGQETGPVRSNMWPNP